MINKQNQINNIQKLIDQLCQAKIESAELYEKIYAIQSAAQLVYEQMDYELSVANNWDAVVGTVCDAFNTEDAVTAALAQAQDIATKCIILAKEQP